MTVIGAGSSGLFSAIELSLRGFEVTLIDRSFAGGGTSGRFHGLLHSGARYAVTDRTAASDCRRESQRIAEMAPHCIERTGGLFVALNENEAEYGSELRKALSVCSIPFSEHDADETLCLEPNLNRNAVYSIGVPDSVLNGRLFLLCALVTALDYGVRFLPMSELVSAEPGNAHSIRALRVANLRTGRTERMDTDFVLDCSGPWISETSEKLGVKVDVLPAAGVMSVVRRRLVLGVVNRMRRPSDGDILVPYGGRTIAGTTAAVTEDISSFRIHDDDVQLLMDEASEMVPAVRRYGFTRSYASFRPLASKGAGSGSRDVARDFRIVRHDSTVDNLISVVGGKMTTCWLAGERAADAVAEMAGGRMKSSAVLQFFNPFDDMQMEGHGFKSCTPYPALPVEYMLGGTDEEDVMAYFLLSRIAERVGAV